MVLAIDLHWNAVRLHHNVFGGIAFAQEGGFIRVASDDSVSVTEQAMRLKEQSEKLPPFPTASQRSIELLLYLVRQVQYATMNGHDKRDVPLLRNRQSDSADSTQRVSVHD